MAHWLVKQEPTSYSYAHLVRDRRTRWDGVHNAAALLYLRSMRPGDQALFYHSGDERACVGILRVASDPHLDTDDPRRSWWVDVTPVRPLARPVALGEIRGDPVFRGFELLRQTRLSVVPVPDPMWERILALSERPAAPPLATGAANSRARASVRPRGRAPGPRKR